VGPRNYVLSDGPDLPRERGNLCVRVGGGFGPLKSTVTLTSAKRLYTYICIICYFNCVFSLFYVILELRLRWSVLQDALLICVGEVELFRSPLVERQLGVHVGAGSRRCAAACGHYSSRNPSIGRRARQSGASSLLLPASKCCRRRAFATADFGAKTSSLVEANER